MLLTMDKILKIREMLTNCDDSYALWDVLTALRGPDYENVSYKTKDATTGVIRYALLGAFAGVGGLDPHTRHLHRAIFGPDREEYVKIRDEMRVSHFCYHARSAFTALGLKWNEVNEP